MRAVCISGGVDMKRIVMAVSSEIEDRIRLAGGLKDVVLVVTTRVCSDENGSDGPRSSPGLSPLNADII